MAHPYSRGAHPKWLQRQKLADGGGAGEQADHAGLLRSESLRNYEAQRTLRQSPPVTVAEDFIGNFSKSKAQDNAVRDAIRAGAIDKLNSTGDY